MLADGRGYNDIVYQLQKFGGLLENVAFEESSDSDEDMVRNLIFRNFISDLLKSFDFHVFQVNILSDLIFFIWLIFQSWDSCLSKDWKGLPQGPVNSPWPANIAVELVLHKEMPKFAACRILYI